MFTSVNIFVVIKISNPEVYPEKKSGGSSCDADGEV